MSYQKDLEEYSDNELIAELNRRQILRVEGVCSYCKKLMSDRRDCRYHEKRVGLIEGGVWFMNTRIVVDRHVA